MTNVNQPPRALYGLTLESGHYKKAPREESAMDVPPMVLSLFRYFLSHPGRVHSREELLREVWHYDHPGMTRTVDSHIKLLRKALGEYGKFITTVRGIGYRLDIDPTFYSHFPIESTQGGKISS